ncbi:MAG: DsbE family thiol:disulfide interchange protein, partial [Quisquiliibacterium sp.]
GNPYAINVSDQKGLVAIDWGVYGAPETFVIDKAGIVRHKHIGPLTADAIERQLVPLLTRLKAQ